MSINLSYRAILNIKGSDYCSVINLISKNEAIKLLQNAIVEHYKLKNKYKNFESINKNGKNFKNW